MMQGYEVKVMKLKNTSKVELNGVKPGDTVEVEDDNGIPKDKFWRRRVKDSAIDGCVKVVKGK